MMHTSSSTATTVTAVASTYRADFSEAMIGTDMNTE